MRDAQLRLIRDGEAVVYHEEPNQPTLFDNQDKQDGQDKLHNDTVSIESEEGDDA